MKNKKTFVIDTSAIIEKIPTNKIHNKSIKEGMIIIPHAVVAELENQANRGKEIGLIGLEELQELQTITKKSKTLSLDFVGDRPSEHQIRHAKSGEIDAYIRSLAEQHDAVLITADRVQAESAKALDIEVDFVSIVKYEKELTLQEYIDDETMSLHIKENMPIMAKKGHPGDWKLVAVSKKTFSGEQIQEFAKEIIEKTRLDRNAYTEISRKCTTVVQYKKLRIVIVRPPVADGWEITIVHPLTKLDLDAYNLPEKLADRVEHKARGIIIAGETGSGKTTLAQAIAEWYVKDNRIVKTIESPRDLQLPDAVTQYSKNFTEHGEIHDILFLSRPDNILFDEMRATPDFELYTDLRLAGSNMIGVLHAAQAIDAVQRFLARLDIGVIPNVVDTIIFMAAGEIKKVLTLQMLVKVPSGMTESDLARPIIEVRDHDTNTLEYEIYSYGEQTVVIPVQSNTKSVGMAQLAAKEIESYFRKKVSHVKVDVVSQNRATVYIPEESISKVIGSAGKNIQQSEEDLGISLDIQELKEAKKNIPFSLKEDKKNIIIYTDPGQMLEVWANGQFVASAISSKKGEVKLSKKSTQGRDVLRAINKRKSKLEVKA